MESRTDRSLRGSFGHTFRRRIAAVAAYSLSLTTVVVGAFPIAPVTPADAAPGDGVCYLIADSGGGNGGNDLLTIVDRGDFDPATNETNIGTGTGTNNIEALDMNPMTLELYGANANRLGTVDKLTGVYSPLPNAFGTANHSTLPSVNITDVDGLAFDYLTGDLWGAERQGGNDVLVRIDITTGRIIPDSFGPGNDYLPTNVGSLGHDDIDDLAFHPFTGVLYGSITGGGGPGRLVTLDTTTGNATDVGPFGTGDIEGMRFDAEGFLWGTSGTTPGQLFEISITTGAATNPRTVDNGGDYESTVCYVPGSDLWVDKTVDDDTPLETTNVTYTIEVFNAGPANATGVVVEDVLPAGVTFVSATGQGSYDHTTGVWTVGSILRNESASLDITVSVDPGTAGSTITNTAIRTAVDQGDAVPNNDTASVDIFPYTAADLAVVKTTSNPTPGEGDTFTYTVGVTNNGPNTATGVTINDSLPAGVTYVSSSPSQGTYTAGSGVWDVGTIAATATATLDITVTVDAGTSLSTITNTAAVGSSDQPDPDPGNNSSSVDIVVPVAGLEVTKSSDATGPVSAGDTIAYTITVENTGSLSFTDVVVDDPLPVATSYVAESTTATGVDNQSSSTSWSQLETPNSAISTSCASPTVISFPVTTDVSLTDINVGFTATHPWRGDIRLDIVSPGGSSVRLAPGVWQNHGQDNFDVLFDAESTGPLNDGDNDNTAAPYYDRSVGAAGLATYVGTSSAGTWTVEVCDTYAAADNGTVNRVELFLSGGSSGTVPLVLDNDPATAIPALDNGAPAALVTAADGFDLPPGETLTVTYEVQVDAQLDGSVAEIVNTVGITANEFSTPVEASVTDPIDFLPLVDIAKDGPTGPVNVGDTVTYSYTVSHTAASDGSPVDVTVTDDVIDLSAITPTGDTDGNGLLDGAETWVYTVDYTIPVTTADPLINVATASGTDLNGDPTPDVSDDHSVDVEFAPALQVTKVGAPAPANVGDTITYTYTVTHAAGSDLSPVGSVGVVDSRGLALTGPAGDSNGNGLLDGSETWVYTASETVTVATPDPLTNDATVTGADRDGDSIPPATDSESIDIEYTPQIQVVKVGPATAEIGEVVTYTFTISHTAGSDLSPVTVNSVVDDVAGVAAFVSGDTNGNALLDGGENWVYTATHTITDVDPDPLVNTVTVTSTDEDGDDLPDAIDSHSTDVEHLPVLEVIKTGPDFALVGDTVVFTFQVFHDAASDGSPVSGLTVTDDYAGTATYVVGDDGDGLLEAGEGWTFTASYTITGSDPDPLVNTGTATGTDEDGDPVEDSDTHSTDVIAPAIDVEKTPDLQTILSGDDATFTITVENTGDVALSDVVVSDPLVSDCEATFGSLAVGAVESYACTAPSVVADFTNTAVVDADHPAGGSVSDSDTADVDVIAPSIDIEKTPDSQTILSGDDATFTITVTNTGDVALSSVVVSDPLVSDCDATFATLAAGAIETYGCTALSVGADFTNTVVVDADHPAGGSVSDSDTADVDVIAPSIDVEKTPDLQTILSGDDATFTITITNTGDAPLTDVVVSDAAAPACDATFPALGVGAVESYTCTLPNVLGDLTNTAVVDADHPAGGSVSDSDVADVDVIAPSIDIDKTPDLQTVLSGDDATFTITVENTGDAPLSNVVVSDPLVSACDAFFASLAVGAVESYTCTLPNVLGDLTNTAVIDADHPAGGSISDSDTADVDVIAPSIDIVKTPDLQTILAGDDATFTITVTNTGDAPLTDLTVTDAAAPGCDATFASLGVGAVESYTCTLPNVLGDLTNVADVTADHPAGGTVTDTDTADVDVIAPAISVQKTPDLQQILVGDDATFTITVTNTGDAPLSNVTVTDAAVPSCAGAFASLAVGAVESYSCTALSVGADFTNTVDVTAQPPVGGLVADSDTADVDVIAPAISVEKTPDLQTILSGDDVTFTITVENTGDVALS
ncbi:MAG: proprotein convertase P-domain-containing protein, partial [Acidimicrobiia bacterium]|nr:proprotein convertase P-domain-containing protein [Acidimicrobiia bacterium]